MNKSKILLICFLLILAVQSPGKAGYFEDGKKYYIYKQYDKAREMFLKRIEVGEHGDSYYFLGEIEKIQGNFTDAEEHYRKAAMIPGTTKKYRKNAFWNIIILTEQRGDYQEVIRVCKEMWDSIRDDSAKTKIESIINKYLWTADEEAIQSYKQGMQYKEKGDKEKALSLFREATSHDWSFLAPKFEIGMYYYKQGDTDNASYYFSDIASRIPFYSEVQLLMGNIHFDRKYFSSALSYFNKALEFGLNDSKTEYHILIKKSNCNYNLGNYDEALADAEEARRMRPSSLDPLLIQAAVMIKQEKYDEALNTLQKAESLKPDNPAILFQIGSIYYSKNDWRYLSYFDRVHGLTKKSGEESKYIRILPLLVKGHYEKNDYSKTVQLIGELPENMINYEIRLIAAHSNYLMGNFDTSIEHFEKISLNSRDQAMLCKAYAHSGREDRAAEMLERYSYNDEFMKEARSDSLLSRLLLKLEKERRQKEEEARKQEELLRQQQLREQERIEEEKRKAAEQERLLQEKSGGKVEEPVQENMAPVDPGPSPELKNVD